MENPVVHLSELASLRGKVSYIDKSEKPVYTYLGIPFAEPPVGELRFKKPVAKNLWNGQIDATEYGPSPHQETAEFMKQILEIAGLPFIKEMSEDCLTLNVFTPAKPSGSSSLPVMVWIYGGGFLNGATIHYPGLVLPALHDVVLVTVNYRVGALGFFSTGDDKCSGNFGLWDQVEGLRWVQQHITKFGGDPNNVTIFGESAGSMSVNMLQISGVSSGLFHKAMLFSGVAKSMHSNAYKSQDMLAKTAGVELGMSENCSPAEIYAALKLMPAEQIAEKIKTTFFTPTIDGELITVDPFTSKFHANKVPSLFLMNSHEGAMFFKMFAGNMAGKDGPQINIGGMAQAEQSINSKEGVVGFFKTMAPMLLRHIKPENVEKLAEEVGNEYIPTSEMDAQKAIMEAIGDFMFGAIPTTLNIYADLVPDQTYFGVYSYRNSRSFHPSFVGADHGDDIMMYLGLAYLKPEDRGHINWTEDDKKMSKIAMEYVSAFAKTGNPNATGLPDWGPHSTKKPQYMSLNTEPKMVDGEFKPNRTKFWATMNEKYA